MQPFDMPVSFARILFATDFLEGSAAALPYVVALARRFDSHVFVTHVVSSELPAVFTNGWHVQSARGPARSFPIERLAGISHEFLIREGEVAPTLCRLARGYDADLIVIGVKPRRTTERLSSLTEEIIRTAPCPVLTIGPSVPWQPAACIDFSRVLFASQSGYGVHGSAQAVALAERCGARLDLLHVVSDSTSRCDRERVAHSLRPMLGRVIPPTANLDFLPSTTVVFDNAAESIPRIAAQQHSDLIVIGVDSPWAEAMFDTPLTTAYEVIVRAECPVVTVGREREEFQFSRSKYAEVEFAHAH